jgi:putative tricarboxylic transport membrane protein
MRRYDIPVAPVIVGMILGPLAEQQFRRALAISQGDLSIFITSPISATVLLIAALAVIVPPIWRRFSRKSQPEQAAPAS